MGVAILVAGAPQSCGPIRGYAGKRPAKNDKIVNIYQVLQNSVFCGGKAPFNVYFESIAIVVVAQ